jgi:hypothetical protein
MHGRSERVKRAIGPSNLLRCDNRVPETCHARSRLLLNFVGQLGLIKRTGKARAMARTGISRTLRMRFDSSRSLPCQRPSIGVLSASLALVSNESWHWLHGLNPSRSAAALRSRQKHRAAESTTRSLKLSQSAPPQSAAAAVRLRRRTTFHNFEHDFSRSRLILWQNKSFADTILTLQSTVYEIFL